MEDWIKLGRFLRTRLEACLCNACSTRSVPVDFFSPPTSKYVIRGAKQSKLIEGPNPVFVLDDLEFFSSSAERLASGRGAAGDAVRHVHVRYRILEKEVMERIGEGPSTVNLYPSSSLSLLSWAGTESQSTSR